MARRRKNTDPVDGGDNHDAPPALANMAARADIIRNACREIVELEAERAAISEQISAIKQQRIKGDLTMKIADFNACLRLYRLEDDDRDQFLDTLRETFEALGIGGQLDFMDALKTAAE